MNKLPKDANGNIIVEAAIVEYDGENWVVEAIDDNILCLIDFNENLRTDCFDYEVEVLV